MKQGQHHQHRDQARGRRGLLPWLLLVLLLLVTHGLLFFIARGRASSSNRSEGAAVPAAGKSHERGDGNSLARGEDVAAGFQRRLRELEETPLAELSQEDFLTAQRELYREWLRRDPRSAFDKLYGPLERWRLESLREELSDELEEVMTKQSRDVASWLDARRYGSRTGEVEELWLRAVRMDGQSDLILERLPEVSLASMDDFVNSLCYSTSTSAAQLAQLRSFLGSARAKEGWSYGRMLDDYARRVVKIPGATTEKLLAAESDPRLRKLIAEHWVGRELAHLPAADAIRAVAALPADARPAAIDKLGESTGRYGNPAGIALLEEMDAQQLLAGLTPRRMEGVLSVLGHERYVTDERRPVLELFTASAALTRPALRETVLEALGASIGSYERPVVLENLSQIPVGRERDVFLGAIASRMRGDDEHLPGILAAIGDRELAGKIQREKDQVKEEDGNRAE